MKCAYLSPLMNHCLHLGRRCDFQTCSAGFYRGVSVNVMRACILNATKMGVYDVSKGYICDYTGWDRKDIRTAFGSAFVAGFFMTCTVSPADNLRTRLMNQPTDKKIYTGFTDCLVKTVKQDGILSLCKFKSVWHESLTT